MNCKPNIASAQAFWQQDYWSGFQSPTDSGIIVLLGYLFWLPYFFVSSDE